MTRKNVQNCICLYSKVTSKYVKLNDNQSDSTKFSICMSNLVEVGDELVFKFRYLWMDMTKTIC